MKLYIMVDMEGISGMVHFEDRKSQTIENYYKWERIRRLLTAEVNAAIKGAIKSGAEEVLINDAHGSCYNILIEELEPIADVIQGDPLNRPGWLVGFDKSFDAIIYIGGHPPAGTKHGVLPHTRWELNGVVLGEVGMAMALAGFEGVPTVLVSGDMRVKEEAKKLCSEVEVVVAKEAYNPFCARNYSPIRIRRLIEEGVIRALKKFRKIPPVTFDKPYILKRGIKDDIVTHKGNNLKEIFLKHLYPNYHSNQKTGSPDHDYLIEKES
jgi:D-amino peptidase